jgi:hypothetical protein
MPEKDRMPKHVDQPKRPELPRVFTARPSVEDEADEPPLSSEFYENFKLLEHELIKLSPQEVVEAMYEAEDRDDKEAFVAFSLLRRLAPISAMWDDSKHGSAMRQGRFKTLKKEFIPVLDAVAQRYEGDKTFGSALRKLSEVADAMARSWYPDTVKKDDKEQKI